MKILPATSEKDLLDIERLACLIWTEHYTPIIGSDQVTYMLDKFQSLPAMKKQLEEGYEYFSIEEQGQLIGYIGIQPREETLFLSKIYLHREVRGKGFGKQAIDFITSLAIERGHETVSLTVNKYNTHTINTYEKCGFEKAEAVVFDIGAGYIMDDYRMVKKLAY